MSARPHDALFKWAFETPQDAAALLRELLPPAVRDAIAWETLEGASGSFVDGALADRHGDLLFAARLRTGPPTPVYLLLEHQSTDDPSMPLRVLAYQIRIWSRFRKEQPGTRLPPIISVLISHARGGWTSARSFEEMLGPDVLAIPGLAALVPRCSMIVDDLAARSDDDLRARALAPFQQLALWLLRDARDPVRLLDRFDAWSPTILEAGQTRSGLDALAVLIHYLFQVLDPLYFNAVRAKLHELGARSKEIAVTIAEYLEEQGRQKGREEGRREGRQEGRQEGHLEGRVAMLRSLLVYKFQSLDAAAEARLQEATPDALERYLRRALTADSLAVVFED
jgi:predicted transposase YdaD